MLANNHSGWHIGLAQEMAAVLSIIDDRFTIQATYGDKLILVFQQFVRICICCPFVLDYHMRSY